MTQRLLTWLGLGSPWLSALMLVGYVAMVVWPIRLLFRKGRSKR